MEPCVSTTGSKMILLMNQNGQPCVLTTGSKMILLMNQNGQPCVSTTASTIILLMNQNGQLLFFDPVAETRGSNNYITLLL